MRGLFGAIALIVASMMTTGDARQARPELASLARRTARRPVKSGGGVPPLSPVSARAASAAALSPSAAARA